MNSSGHDKESKVGIIQALLAFIGVVIAAYIGYLGVRSQVEVPIHATQTSEVIGATGTSTVNLTTQTQQAQYQQEFAMTATAFYLAATTAQARYTQQAISLSVTPITNPVEIAVLNVNTTTLPDGTVQNSADLSVSPLGLGSLQLTSPSTIKLGESSIIRLAITPDSALASLPKVSAPTISANSPDYVLEFSDRLQIYPVMIAELKGVNFEIESDNRPEKPVTSDMPVEWLWNVTPLYAGKQTLILSISIPVIIDHTHDVVSAQTLKNIPIEIRVEVTPTPIPSETPKPTQTPIPTSTPTPLPPIARIGEKLIENVSTVVVAIIGLIGVLAGAYVTYINAQKSKAAKSGTSKAKKK